MRARLKTCPPFVTVALVSAILLGLLSAAAPAQASHAYNDGAHWQRDGTAVAQVYFVDSTPAYWPVNAATIEWNSAANLGAYWLSPSDYCPFHCVPVESGTAQGSVDS